jgi:N-acyl-D-amino-acid deacylase
MAAAMSSDGGLNNGQGNPRSAGTHARVLGKYVREEKALSLIDAIRQKGRLKAGADAE